MATFGWQPKPKFSCPYWHVGHVCLPHPRIGYVARSLVALFGASIVSAPPLLNRIQATGGPTPIADAVFGTGLVFSLAWILSVGLTVYMHEDHILKYLLMSMGLPGLFVSAALMPQLFG